MKVTYSWLKDFVDIKITPKTLAEKLTMAGIEVTSIDERDGDFVFDIEVTSNRPDWLSVIGIAREVAAITGKKLKIPSLAHTRLAASGSNALEIRVEDKKDCPLYTAKIIRNVKVAPSPVWLKKRLELVDLRSVNNIVDITNYILFTFGEPLHAFDLDKLSAGSIFIRRAKKDEKIVTIEAVEKTLDPEILVIADGKKAVAIAGIMGGKSTEVTFNTKNILLEAAIFNPVVTRRSRRKLGMQTDSSYRFERGIDPETALNASWQAVRLIEELSGGKCVLAKSTGVIKTKSKNINLPASDISKILGVDIAPVKIKKILTGLGFKVSVRPKNNFSVTAPSFRQDIVLGQDLIEEIARIYGYDLILKTLPEVKPHINGEKTGNLVSLVKNTLVCLGLNEAITYSLIDRELLAAFSLLGLGRPIEILNPLSREQEVLRPTALPSLCARVAYNLNQKQDYVNLFEISRIFLDTSAAPREELTLSIALCGIKSYVLAHGIIKEEVGLLNLKGITEALFESLGIKDFDLSAEGDSIGVYVKKEKIGIMLQLEKDTLDKFDIKNKDVFVLEVSLDKLFRHAQLKKCFAPLPKYPGITRDISFIIKDSVSIKEILGAIKVKGVGLLTQVKVADYYKGQQIPAGFRGLTLSCLYRGDERTLTEEEISPLHASISNMLTERFEAKIR